MKTPNSVTNLGKAISRYCGSSVLTTVDEAVTWANDLIVRIDAQSV